VYCSNTSGEYKIFKENEIQWNDFQPREEKLRSFYQRCNDVEGFMETAKENALSALFQLM